MTVGIKDKFIQIIIDTREKLPWTFSDLKVKSAKLDCGDYSIAGRELEIAIERKKSVSELAGNITKQHFWDAMERLSKISSPYFICEFSEVDIATYPRGPNGLPKHLWKRVRVKPAFIFSSLNKIAEMGITVILTDDNISAQEIAESILLCIK